MVLSQGMKRSHARLRRILEKRFNGTVCPHPKSSRIKVAVENVEIDGIALETEPSERCGLCSRWLVPEGEAQ